MDSPEEVTSPLLNASSPDILPEEERPCTPELDDSDDEHINNMTSEDLPFKPIVSPPGYEPPSSPVGYEPPSSPIELPSMSGNQPNSPPATNDWDDDEEADNSKAPDTFEPLSDGEEEQNQGQRSGLIIDIFGDSDDEEEEEEKKDEEQVVEEPQKEKDKEDEVDTDEEAEMLNKNDSLYVNDFDVMMEKKKQARKRSMSRKKKDVTDIINDSDDRILYMITQMKDASEEDKRLNLAGQAAVNKLSMLSDVMKQLNKSDLQTAFIDCGILPILADWLSPLPDHSLPHITIRTAFLKLLKDYTITTDMLKDSKLGRVVMGLYKNSKELFSNREIARKLIHNWSRPIFGLNSDYSALSREERVAADLNHMMTAKKRKRRQSEDKPKEDAKPGDKDFCMRARVPIPSNTDYVIRPRSSIEEDVVKRPKKQNPRLEKFNTKAAKKKQNVNPTHLRSSNVCLTGSKMPL